MAGSDFVVGAKGGVYCASLDDLKTQLLNALGSTPDLVAGCGVLAPRTLIRSAHLFKNGAFEGGVGVIDAMAEKGAVAFVAIPPDEPPPAPPESTDKVKFDLVADPRSVIRLSGADVQADMRKWIGKVVETRATCFYAGNSDFHCSSARFRVDFTEIEPARARAVLEHECDTLQKASRPVCAVPIRFKYSDAAKFYSGETGVGPTRVTAAANVGYVPPQRVAQKRPASSAWRASAPRRLSIPAYAPVAVPTIKGPLIGE